MKKIVSSLMKITKLMPMETKEMKKYVLLNRNENKIR